MNSLLMAEMSQLSSCGNSHRMVLLSTEQVQAGSQEYPPGRRETSHASPWTSESNGRSYEIRKGNYVGGGTLNAMFVG